MSARPVPVPARPSDLFQDKEVGRVHRAHHKALAMPEKQDARNEAQKDEPGRHHRHNNVLEAGGKVHGIVPCRILVSVLA